jgi:uncharacterized membrane protein
MSYIKKLNNFLAEAKSQNIIDEIIYNKLHKFSEEQNGAVAANRLIGVISFLGGFAILLGMILLISHNWREISDFLKISFYVTTLAAIHFLGFYWHEKYPKVSSSMHFIGAGYVLAGIGLIAQIFHLSSNDGQAFLIWFAMILPLVFILKNKLIGVMAIFAFYTWLTINSQHHLYLNSVKGALIYFTNMSISLILIPRVFSSFEDSFDYLKSIGSKMLLAIIMLLGFSHEIFSHTSLESFNEYHLHPILELIIVANIATLVFLSLKKELQASLGDKALLLLISISFILPFLIMKDYLMFISVLCWIIWFSFSAIMIQSGIVQGSRSNINLGTWLFVIGILARFIDLVGTMLFTGSMFIIFGVILITLAILGEKYRKYLISKISKQ